MRRIIILAVSVLVLSSCGVSVPTYTLYNWGGKYTDRTSLYEELSYRTFKEQTPAVMCKLICCYETMVSNPGGNRQVPPPGICAEYAYLLLQEGTADTFSKNADKDQRAVFGSETDYASLFRQKASELFEKEVELYPESERFIKPLIQKFQSR